MTIDLRDPSFRADPHVYLAAKREEAAAHVEPLGATVVLRHAEVSQLLRDPRLGKDLRRWQGYPMIRPYGAGTTFERHVEAWMLSREAPDHTRLRRLAATAFTPRAVAAMRAAVVAVADALVAALPADGEVELLSAFAEPFPVRVICQLVGFPEDDYAQLKVWSDGLALAVELLPRKYPEAERAAQAMVAYVHEHLARRRREPAVDDLLGTLIAARDEDQRLDDDELVAMVLLLFVAAHETTTSVIAGGLLALIQQPDALAHLRAEPQIMATAVEELVRFDAPGPFSGRAAHEPLSIAGVEVPAGGLVMLGLSAANRDPRVFEHPERLDLSRRPNPHVGFGGGIHYCLGAPLARMEAAIAFERLLARWPVITVAEPGPRWLKRFGLRGLAALPLHVGAVGQVTAPR
jgi:cytochrome P450